MSDSFDTPWTVAHHTLLLMGFPRQEYWSGLPFSSPGDLPGLGIEPESPVLVGEAILYKWDSREAPVQSNCVLYSSGERIYLKLGLGTWQEIIKQGIIFFNTTQNVVKVRKTF